MGKKGVKTTKNTQVCGGAGTLTAVIERPNWGKERRQHRGKKINKRQKNWGHPPPPVVGGGSVGPHGVAEYKGNPGFSQQKTPPPPPPLFVFFFFLILGFPNNPFFWLTQNKGMCLHGKKGKPEGPPEAKENARMKPGTDESRCEDWVGRESKKDSSPKRQAVRRLAKTHIIIEQKNFMHPKQHSATKGD